MRVHDNSTHYLLVIVKNEKGTYEAFRQPILGGDTIYPTSYENEQFYGLVNLSASRGLVINNVQSSDAGKFLCRYKGTETKVSGHWEVELIVFNGKHSQVNQTSLIISPVPQPASSTAYLILLHFRGFLNSRF